MSLLTDARRYVREFQKALAMRDWTFVVGLSANPHGLGSDSWASVTTDVHTRYAEIMLNPNADHSDLRQTIAHEVLHVVLGDVDRAVLDHTKGDYPAGYARAEEVAINRIADALVRGA